MKIALVGYSRSGKDSVAEIINNMTPTIQMAFAGEMKDSFHDMFPHIPRDPKPRMEYEKYGQAMREIYSDVWIDKVAEEVKCYGDNFSIIITDVRKPNEADWCKANGFTIVQVLANEDARRERAVGETMFVPILPSEMGMWRIAPDHTIINNGTYQELEAATKELIRRMGESA